MMITLDKPITGFGGLSSELDRIEILSFAYHRERGREPHLDIGVEVGRSVEAELVKIEPREHSGWKMSDDGPTRTCNDCETVQKWEEETGDRGPETGSGGSSGLPSPVSGRWLPPHDMEACLANREAETRVISEAHIHWLGGTSIIVKGDELEGLGVGALESAVGALIQKMAEQPAAQTAFESSSTPVQNAF